MSLIDMLAASGVINILLGLLVLIQWLEIRRLNWILRNFKKWIRKELS